MVSPIPSVKLKVEADHSCNWKCCFGCREQEVDVLAKQHPNTPDSIVERVEHVVEKRWHHKQKIPRTKTQQTEDE